MRMKTQFQKKDELGLHHHITIRFGKKNPVKSFVKAVATPVVNTAKGVGNFVQNPTKELERRAEDIGQSTGKAVLDAANLGLQAGGTYLEYTVGLGPKLLQFVDDNLLNGNVDLYTGGLIDDSIAASKAVRYLGEKRAVESNVKAGVRVGAITAAALATGGATAPLIVAAATPNARNNTWEGLFSGIATGAAGAGAAAVGGGFLGDLINTGGSLVSGLINPQAQYNNVNDTNPYPTTIIEPASALQRAVPFIVIGVTLITLAALAAKKKKR